MIILPSAWSVAQRERGYYVYNNNRSLMMHLPLTLTPEQVRDCAWLHYASICGGGSHAT